MPKALAAALAASVLAVAAPAGDAAHAAPTAGASAAAADCGGATSATAPGGERGAYEWDDSTWWPGPSAYATTLGHLQSLGITTIYVDITRAVTLVNDGSSQLSPFLSDFEQLVEEAGGCGMVVDAVGGDPTWATTDRKGPGQLLSAVAEVEAELPVTAPLDGVQFDVEPWALSGWHAHRGAYERDWLRFLRSTVSTWQSDGLSGRLGFTAPYWFDGVQGGAPKVMFDGTTTYPFQHALTVLSPLGSTVLNVMAYRNTTSGPNGTLALFDGDLNALTALGSRTMLLVGQETGDAQPAETTFYGLGCDALTTAEGQIATALDGEASYAGIAVDDVESLEALCPQ
jgi:hypothetical protein